MPLDVYMPNPPGGSFVDDLAAALDQPLELHTGEAMPDPARYEVLIAGRPTEEQLAASPGLRAVVIPFAGVPTKTRRLMNEHPHLSFHNLHHNAAPTAEMAMGLLLAAAKRIVPADGAFRRGDWSVRYDDDSSLLLEGRTAAILGFGAIGRRIARACLGLGMQPVALRRRARVRTIEDGVPVHPATELEEVLTRAEALFIALPHTEQTDGLLDARRLSLLPAGTIVVNVARGAVIDEAALYHALLERRIGAAGLDVWWRYPEDEHHAPERCRQRSRFTNSTTSS